MNQSCTVPTAQWMIATYQMERVRPAMPPKAGIVGLRILAL